MRSKKKLGGIRRQPAREESVQAAPPARAKARRVKKKVGGVRPVEPGSSVGHAQCDVCDGIYVQGMWTHSPECSHMAVRWKAHGASMRTWDCPYGCPGVELPSAISHHAECRFWEEHPGLTPFDDRFRKLRARQPWLAEMRL